MTARPPGLLSPPLPPGTKYTDIMRLFHRDCQQAHKSTPLKPQHRCLVQTRETQRSSTGRDDPALSSAAAVLSLCRHITFPFASTSLPCTRHRCLAQLRRKNHLGLQQAEISLHAAKLLLFTAADVTFHFPLTSLPCRDSRARSVFHGHSYSCTRRG